MVAASGNDGSPEKYYPGAHVDVIAVGAGDAECDVAAFSSYGAEVSMIAPKGAKTSLKYEDTKMSNSLLLKGLTGFRFTRPTIGQIGATDNLHSYVEAAVDTLVTRLERGFKEPPTQTMKQKNQQVFSRTKKIISI